MDREPGGDLSLLAENLRLLLERSGEVLQRPEYFFCEPSFAHASILYFYEGPIPLGVLAMALEGRRPDRPLPGVRRGSPGVRR